MNYHILALDDEPHMLVLLERIIREKTPYTILTTNNALEVPRLLEQHCFDVIIADLKMPGMDGIDILRLVKQQNRAEEVIIITAFGSLDTALEAISLGVFDYVTKPFKKEQIIFAVDRAIQWQAMKRTVHELAPLCTVEPYEQALRAFEQTYVRKLAQRYKGNTRSMSERAGIPEEKIREVLGRQDPSSREENNGNQKGG